VELTSDGSATPSVSDTIVLAASGSYAFYGRAVARDETTGSTCVWSIDGAIKSLGSVSTTALIGTPTATQTFCDSAAAGWSLTLSADTTLGGLSVTVTPTGSSHTVHLGADIQVTEVD
jgi:hypothetical protein